MHRVWRTIKGYILWTYDRGSVHYDIMVTLILAFIFLTPPGLFNDRPTERTLHLNEVIVSGDGRNGFSYQVASSAVDSQDDDSIRDSLLKVIEPIAGEVDLTSYEAIRDHKGKIVAYRAHVSRR
jgi:hypothetical protein